MQLSFVPLLLFSAWWLANLTFDGYCVLIGGALSSIVRLVPRLGWAILCARFAYLDSRTSQWECELLPHY